MFAARNSHACEHFAYYGNKRRLHVKSTWGSSMSRLPFMDSFRLKTQMGLPTTESFNYIAHVARAPLATTHRSWSPFSDLMKLSTVCQDTSCVILALDTVSMSIRKMLFLGDPIYPQPWMKVMHYFRMSVISSPLRYF